MELEEYAIIGSTPILQIGNKGSNFKLRQFFKLGNWN